jgi:hypothetical protein
MWHGDCIQDSRRILEMLSLWVPMPEDGVERFMFFWQRARMHAVARCAASLFSGKEKRDMFFSLGKVGVAVRKRIHDHAFLTDGRPAKTGPGGLEAARVRHFLRQQGELPSGSYEGARLSKRKESALRSLLDLPASETILVAYFDCLMGQVLQCGVLTESGFHVMEQPGVVTSFGLDEVLRIRPYGHFVTCGDEGKSVVCLNRRANGFLRLVRRCLRKCRG